MARVVAFEKRRPDPATKFYSYELAVAAPGTYRIWRRYSDFHSLHERLQATYPTVALPVLPPKLLLQRSHVRSVAERRLPELDAYLQMLLAMPTVASSAALVAFLSPTSWDLNTADQKTNEA
jgi:hypothetical protein